MLAYRAAPLALVVLYAGFAACARSRDVAAEPADSIGDSVFVEVINDNYYDARIHVLYTGGAPYSLGTIPGNQRLPVRAIPWQPRSLVIEVSLIIGGGTYRSDRVDVARGAVLEIRVPANLRDSAFFRRVSR
jgi:hypothetical protein